MDFGTLLYKAQKNDQDNKQNAGWYRTGFAPPKKEQREKKLSANIQKFLAKKEEEEKRKRLEAEKKKQELLMLRNKDKKSFKRVKSMLTKTKSANKSVIEDAVDNVNTAVTANGPAQPDEDDYGYVSKDAEDLYNKLINKYNNMPPEESKFSKVSSKCSKDVLSTKDRVKAALQREEEEKFLPKKRKRKSKNGEIEEEEKSDDEKKDVEKEEKKVDGKTQNKFKIPKRNPQQPPPIDFQSLLKLAEKKQHEPIMIEKKVEEKPERPMTEKEKLEYMREKERRLRKEMGISESSQKASDIAKAKAMKSKSDIAVKGQSDTSSVPIDKLKNGVNSNLKKSLPSTSSSQKPIKPSPTPKKVKIEEPKLETSQEEKTPPSAEKSAIGVLSERQKMILAHKRNAELETRKMAMLEARRKEAKLKSMNQTKEPYREKLSNTPSKIPKTETLSPKISKSSDGYSSKNIPSKPLESKKPTSASIPSRQFPPPDVISRQFPPPDVARRFPPSDTMRKKPQPVMRRKVIESDDEYDSEMDDFIDDSEAADVSQYISEIFGYDRRKYSARDYDDDDECMESNFSELQKEEFISTKYGIMEDLEDVRRTKAEKLRKKKRMMS